VVRQLEAELRSERETVARLQRAVVSLRAQNARLLESLITAGDNADLDRELEALFLLACVVALVLLAH
jgi:hypothetical protein